MFKPKLTYLKKSIITKLYMKFIGQLFLLHFAGGNKYSFDFLTKEIRKRTSEIELIPLELPGRGARFNEELLLDKIKAIDFYVNQIKKERTNIPYLVYGHSMGATLGLSVIRRMENYNDPPLQFIATGNAGPGVIDKLDENFGKKKYLLNDKDLKNELRRLGGVPEEILHDDELFVFFSEIIRADFQLLEEKENYEIGMSINTSINVFMGDEERTSNQIDNWRNYTKSHFEKQILSGNHFFIYNHTKEIVDAILERFSCKELK